MVRHLKLVKNSCFVFFTYAFSHLKLYCNWLIFLFQKPKRNNCEIIVSFTSYPPRFSSLNKTCKSLLSQSQSNFIIVLWIAEEDYNSLPQDVLSLQRFGLRIAKCKNYYSYKKIIPAVQEYPESIIVTADDDVFYDRNWLSQLIEIHSRDTGNVVCHRMHRIRLAKNNHPLPYSKWQWNVTDNQLSPQNFATGAGGVLYPARLFVASDFPWSEILLLCSKGDDLWLYWLARMKGKYIVQVGRPFRLVTWKGTQSEALWKTNVNDSVNDNQVSKLIEKFGFPK